MLEMLSGTKWNNCGLLLILFFCKGCIKPSVSYASNAVTVACNGSLCKNANTLSKLNLENLKHVDNVVLVGADGFVGQMSKDDCRSNNNHQSSASGSRVSCPHSTCPQSGSGNGKLFVLFGTNNLTSANKRPSDFGVSLSESTQYEITIQRNKMPQYVCLIEGQCRCSTWANWINTVFFSCHENGPADRLAIWTLQDSSFLLINDSCNMTCLNPLKTCQNTDYTSNNSCDNINIIKIPKQFGPASCSKYGSPTTKVPPISIPSQMMSKFNKTKIDPEAAVGVMKNLSDLLTLMGNETLTSVIIGNVQGILKKIENQADIKTAAFVYSAESSVTVINDLDELKKYPNAFVIPQEASVKAFNQTAGNAFLGVFRFPNMAQDENSSKVLNNEVYAIEMGTKISNLNESISLTFTNAQTNGTPVCHAWDGSGNKPNWTTDGCNTAIEGNKITCTCDHLTFFAILMAPPAINIPQQDLINLTYITYIGCGLSMFFLGIGLFMHFLLRKAKANNSVRVLMNLFMALFLLNVAFLSNEYVARAKDITACRVMAGFMHFCLLATFTWFGVEAFHLCMQMSKYSVTIKHYIIKITVVGWVPSALLVTIIFFLSKYGEQTIQTDTSNNATMCWILDSTVHYVVNIGYYCFIFIFTFGTFIVVLRWLCMLRVNKWNKTVNVKRSGTATSDITTIMGLCCLLGLTWSFTFFSYGALRVPSYYIFSILNSFQGFFLFIYYLKTSTLIGDAAPTESSSMTGETKTDNPYENQLSTIITNSCDK
ncbi:adhesion G-protein coupled receptor G2-like [Myxocyprinus asiaticus]|uniref:adhesion G-protein coupled receptor G2-like n=1 Tax=Myxocyprinus asiaticus TaxID=70543 RepID=UPI002221B3DC|nr:adhesion G-protein coupled receptor G2-like [Myxocyprinus asiaticus]